MSWSVSSSFLSSFITSIYLFAFLQLVSSHVPELVTTPLVWQFQEQPIMCQANNNLEGICVQAGLGSSGMVVTFDGHSGKTWIYNARTNITGSWTQFSNSNSPTKRALSAMIQLSDNKLLLFGGVPYKKNTSLNLNNKNIEAHNGKHIVKQGRLLSDIWIFSYSNGWSSVVLQNAPACAGHAMASLGNNSVLAFGGYDADFRLTSNSYIYTYGKGWTTVKSDANPPARYLHAMGSLIVPTHPVSTVVVLFGGADLNLHFYGDFWEFDGTKWISLRITPTFGGAPIGRAGHAIASLEDDLLLLYGGFPDPKYGNKAGDTITYTFSATQGWTAFQTLNSPSSRYLHTMSRVNVDNVILHGGIIEKNSELSPETWVFNKINGWNQVQATTAPPTRSSFAMAITGEGKQVMYGGIPGNDQLGPALCDTWFNIGDGWNELDTNLQNPGQLCHHAMATFDKDKILLFGGVGGNRAPSNTYLFVDHQSLEETWQIVEPTSTKQVPFARSEPAMTNLAKDPGKVLMFGGLGLEEPHKVADDTWIFTMNEQWTKLSYDKNASVPPARASHALASLGDGKALLFGGSAVTSNNNLFDDTWIFHEEFDAHTHKWVELKFGTNTLRPPKRSGHAMATLGHGKVVLFGGDSSHSETLSDTWMFIDQSMWIQLPATGIPRSGFAMVPATSVTSSGEIGNMIKIFGGFVELQTGANMIRMPAQDTWSLIDGCPLGHAAPSCTPCATGSFKNSNAATGCDLCPSGTTTGTEGAISVNECLLCSGTKTHTTSASCFVDISGNFTSQWQCYGSFGHRCQNLCPGGFESPCNAHGKCDSGIRGNGTCTCDPKYYGEECQFACDCHHGTCDESNNGTCTCPSNYYDRTCSEQCKCHNGHCDDGADGTGQCTCTFAYWLSSDCSFPFVAVLLGMLAVSVFAGIFIFCRRTMAKQHRATVHTLETAREEEASKYLLLEEETQDQERKRIEPLSDVERQQLEKHLDTLIPDDLESGETKGSSKHQSCVFPFKFVSESLPTYRTGGIKAAARGLTEFMMVDESDMELMWRSTIADMDAAEEAIVKEVREYQSKYEPNNTAEIENAQNEAERNDAEGIMSLLDYVINQPSSEKIYSNGKRDEGRNGMRLEDFMKHPNVAKAQLKRPHVIALRFYTTMAFWRINQSLKSEVRTKHPLPFTVHFIWEGAKLLRRVAAEHPNMPTVLWRGVKNVSIDRTFKERGGTHFSPMSTTSDLDVAIKYGTCNAGSLIFKIDASTALRHGADLEWLSAFASEKEELFPPLTFLQPSKDVNGRTREQTVTSSITGASVTVVELVPDLSA